MKPKAPLLFVLVICLSTGLISHTLAQNEDDVWSDPRNLSHSGAAEQPQIVAGPDGTMQIFWWDRFDGLTGAYYDGESWSDPESASIFMSELVGEEYIYTPISAIPTLAADAHGWVHAFWMGPADRDTGAPPLMHSQRPLGGTYWSPAQVLAESAVDFDLAADPSGALTLAYVRALHEPAFPAGVYVKRTAGGGGGWSYPTLVYGSIYFRLPATEEIHLDIAADEAGRVHLAWEDPHLDRALYAHSTDGGSNWTEPVEIGDLEEGARRPRVAVGQENEVLRLWEADRVAAPCALYQQRSSDGGETWDEGQRALEDLGRCPEAPDLLTASGQMLFVTGSGGSGLTLAVWDGALWSEPKGLGFSFEDAELEQRVYLDSLQLTLDGDRLAVVGLGQDGEVWFLESRLTALEWAFTPPPPWSEPLNVSQSAGYPGRPAMATDIEGRVHLLWSEAPGEYLPGTALYYSRLDSTVQGGRWTRPAAVLRSPEGKAEQPDLLILGDHLHAVWSGGSSGEILYSRAYTRDGYAPGGWSEPQYLPAPSEVGSWPQIAADLGGTLHVIYAVPLNENRGIYYTRSDDGGESWSTAQAVFDAAAAGWAMVDRPSLAVDRYGTLHVAWVRAALPGSGLPQGIYYIRSTDQGAPLRQDSTESSHSGPAWSEPWAVAEEAGDWPQVIVGPDGQVHLLWQQVSGNAALRHRWTSNGEEGNWSYSQQVRGFTGLSMPVGVVAAGAANLHLAGLGQDDIGATTLLYTTWSGERWEEPEIVPLRAVENTVSGIAILPQAALGRVNVAFRGQVENEDGTSQAALLYANRTIPTVVVAPLPTFTPLPQEMPTPAPSPTVTPTPQPTVNTAAPPPAPSSLEMGPINLPFTTLGGLLLAVLIVGGVVTVRGLRAGRR